MADTPYTEREILQALVDLGGKGTEEQIAIAIEVARALNELVQEGRITAITRDGVQFYEETKQSSSSVCDDCKAQCGSRECLVVQWAHKE